MTMVSCPDDNPQTRRYIRAMRLYRHGRYQKAAGYFQAISQSAGMIGQLARYYQAFSHRKVGLDALAAGEFDQAAESLRLAATTAGSSGDLTGFRAGMCAAQGRFDDCTKLADRMVDTNQNCPQARRRSAQALWQSGQIDQAYMTLTQAIRRFSDEACLHMQLGLFYAAQEHYARAREALELAGLFKTAAEQKEV